VVPNPCIEKLYYDKQVVKKEPRKKELYQHYKENKRKIELDGSVFIDYLSSKTKERKKKQI